MCSRGAVVLTVLCCHPLHVTVNTVNTVNTATVGREGGNGEVLTSGAELVIRLIVSWM